MSNAKPQKHYRFEVVHAPKLLAQTGDFMSRMDLGINSVWITDIVTFSSSSTDKTIEQYKEKLKEAFEQDGGRVKGIIGGEV